MTEWIGTGEAAEIIGVNASTVYRSIVDPESCAEWWGEEGVGWRRKPLSPPRKPAYQVSKERAEVVAKGRTSRRNGGSDPRTD